MKPIIVEDFTKIKKKGNFGDLLGDVEKKTELESLEYYFNSSKGTQRKPAFENLGIYWKENDKCFMADRLVGIMPVTIGSKSDFEKKIAHDKKKSEKDSNSSENNGRSGIEKIFNNYYWCVKPKWGNPFKMLTTIMESDEFFDDDIRKLLEEPKIKSYEEWVGYDITGKNSDFLYGLLVDKKYGKIDVSAHSEDDKNAISTIADNMNILIVYEYLTQLETICKRVLKQQSLPYEENMTGKVKGRILINKQIRHNLSKGRIDRNYCSYNKMSIDNKENQILKYALHICKKWSAERGSVFSDKILFCDNVLKSVRLVKVTKADIRSVKTNGAFKAYKEGMIKAEAVLDSLNLAFDRGKEEVRTKKIVPFFIRMDLLFELYCRALFENALKEVGNHRLAKYGEESTRSLFNDTDSIDIPVGYQNKHIADILVKNDKENAFVVDAKYSLLAEGYSDRIRGNTHQLLAYTLLFDTKSCGFIYPIRGMMENRLFEYEAAANHYYTVVDNKIAYKKSVKEQESEAFRRGKSELNVTEDVVRLEKREYSLGGFKHCDELSDNPDEETIVYTGRITDGPLWLGGDLFVTLAKDEKNLSLTFKHYSGGKGEDLKLEKKELHYITIKKNELKIAKDVQHCEQSVLNKNLFSIGLRGNDDASKINNFVEKLLKNNGAEKKNG